MPIIIITLVILIVSLRGLRNTAQSSSVNKGSFDLSFSGWFKVAQILGVLFTMLQVLMLVGGLLVATGSLESLYYAVKAAFNDIIVSSQIAFAGAILGGAFGYVLSHRLIGGRLWWIALSTPLALPSSLVGISLISAYTAWLPMIYGTMAMPILAVVIRFVAISAIIIYAQSKRMDPLLFESAELFEKSSHQALLKVKIPLQRYGIAAAIAVLLAFSIGELGSTLLVVPPGSSTLTIRIFNYLHYGGSEEVAGLCLVIVALMMTLTGLAFKVYQASETNQNDQDQ